MLTLSVLLGRMEDSASFLFPIPLGIDPFPTTSLVQKLPFWESNKRPSLVQRKVCARAYTQPAYSINEMSWLESQDGAGSACDVMCKGSIRSGPIPVGDLDSGIIQMHYI